MILSHDRSPRGKTYPIGASGSIISDLRDEDGIQQEFLCCFLAKDKRMVVFELKSKKVIVELQMTTKLNFWRWLPPIADGHNLVFLLITPIGKLFTKKVMRLVDNSLKLTVFITVLFTTYRRLSLVATVRITPSSSSLEAWT